MKKNNKEVFDEKDPAKYMTYLKIILRLLLAAIFIFSAYSKIIAPGIFEILLIDNGIFTSRYVAAIFTRLLIGSELTIGLLFLQPYYIKKFVIPAALFVLITFTIYLAYTGFIKGDQGNCGCFGELVKMSPVESIIKNIITIIIAVVLFVKIKTEKKNKIIPIGIVVVSFLFVFTIAPIRDNNNFKFAKYTHFIGKGRTDLTQGDVLLAIFNTECEHCQAAATEIGKLQKENKNLPDIYALFFTEGEISVDSFDVMTNTKLPYNMIDVNTFFDLIGTTPPRIYWLHDGAVKETWDNKIPERIKENFIK